MPSKYTKEQLMHKKIANYGFLISFFLIFSFFIFVAIKPNLETAFRLKKELADLKEIDKKYDTAINKIIEIQTILENHRDELPLLDQALPVSPLVSNFFVDIQKSASDSGLPLSKVTVSEIELKKILRDKKTKQYKVVFVSSAPFESVQQFVTNFLSQRRLKLIKSMEVTSAQKDSSASAKLEVSFDIEAYYL